MGQAIIIDFDVSNLCFLIFFYLNNSINIYDLVLGLHCQSFRDAEKPVQLWYVYGKKARYLHGSFWRRKKSAELLAQWMEKTGTAGWPKEALKPAGGLTDSASVLVLHSSCLGQLTKRVFL